MYSNEMTFTVSKLETPMRGVVVPTYHHFSGILELIEVDFFYRYVPTYKSKVEKATQTSC